MTTLSIDQALALCAVLNDKPAPCAEPNLNASEKGDGRTVIVRSRDAGVLYGDYAGRDGANIHLRNAVQMWQWFAAKGGTLVDCAVHGVNASKCKFSVASATLTVFNACTLIDCTAEGAQSLRKVEGSKWA